ILGITMLLTGAGLGYYLGPGVTCIGVVLFGIGLRKRLKETNPSLGSIILIGSIVAAAILAFLAYSFK
ncbi:MAG: hypothetical protein U9N80_07635, partial [Chloroflexota bacterium]|nr:hypothetical protein [Chloroflexota bacterium]